MDEYIDREAAQTSCRKYSFAESYDAFAVDCILKAIPAADVAPVRHGRWIDAYPDIEPNPMFMYGICSECGFEQGISKYLNFCPNCGAKMDGGDGNSDMV